MEHNVIAAAVKVYALKWLQKPASTLNAWPHKLVAWHAKLKLIYIYIYVCILGLGDIEIMHCDYCSKRHCDYCYIALEHFAVVKAEHHTTSVS